MPVNENAEKMTLDDFGRFLAQLLADAEETSEVSTYRVLANWVHVTTTDGSKFSIDIYVQDEDIEVKGG